MVAMVFWAIFFGRHLCHSRYNCITGKVAHLVPRRVSLLVFNSYIKAASDFSLKSHMPSLSAVCHPPVNGVPGRPGLAVELVLIIHQFFIRPSHQDTVSIRSVPWVMHKLHTKTPGNLQTNHSNKIKLHSTKFRDDSSKHALKYVQKYLANFKIMMLYFVAPRM